MKILNVTCPQCKKNFNYYSSEFRPFCSERCRLIDLGQWLNESYTVPAEKITPEEEEKLEQLINEKNQSSDEDDSSHQSPRSNDRVGLGMWTNPQRPLGSLLS